MAKPVASVVTVVLGIAVALLALGLYRNHIRSDGFEQVSPGDRRERVLERLGSPDHIEPGWAAFAAYANTPCDAPCHERLWWENALLPRGIEAWSVDLDATGRVLHKAHWVSP